jgi:site-specific recombinase XerD
VKAAATINRELQALRHMFNKTIAWRKCAHNPMKQVNLRREENTRLRFLSSEEETNFLDSCGETLRSIVIAALIIGFRRASFSLLRGKMSTLNAVW